MDSDKKSELKGHTDPVTNVKFSPIDENLLLSCSGDKTLKLWDTRTNKLIKSEKTKSGSKNITWSHDASMFAFSNKDDDQISIYDMKKFQFLKNIQFKNKITEFEFEKTNSILIVTSMVGSLYIINAETLDENPLAVLDAHYPPINTLCIDRSNKYFATGAADALICLWNMNELMSYKVIKKGEVPIRKISYSYDSKLLAAIYEGNNLDIFDSQTTECVYSIYTESQQYSLAWHPNKYVLAYCGDDKNRNNVDEGNIHLLINQV